MKEDTHPTYYPDAKVTCACGNEFTIGSTEEELEVEICSDCHPFYTGVEKVVDTAGRVEKFKQRQEKAAERQKKAERQKEEEAEDAEEENEEDAAESGSDLEDIKKQMEADEA